MPIGFIYVDKAFVFLASISGDRKTVMTKNQEKRKFLGSAEKYWLTPVTDMDQNLRGRFQLSDKCKQNRHSRKTDTPHKLMLIQQL